MKMIAPPRINPAAIQMIGEMGDEGAAGPGVPIGAGGAIGLLGAAGGVSIGDCNENTVTGCANCVMAIRARNARMVICFMRCDYSEPFGL